MKNSPRLVENARKLRVNMTDAERRLWHSLRGRRLSGFKFRRQYVVGEYILDFYCHDAKLAVELDGGGHAEPGAQDRDERRTEILRQQGIEVVRFWNHDVLLRTEIVLGELMKQLHARMLGRG